MTSREIVRRTIEFQRPQRLAHCFSMTGENDFCEACPDPKMDGSFGAGVDAWGVNWESVNKNLKGGQVSHAYIEDWNDLSGFTFPVPGRANWDAVKKTRQENPDLYMIGPGASLYARLHYLRGQLNTWMDIHEQPEALCAFLDRLADFSIELVERYADIGCDAYMYWDDWGLQDRLMISPESWRQLWKPRYARVFDAAHRRRMRVFMHSCGYIIDILPDLAEIGLDVIQQDQQINMGVDNLAKLAGKITFFCPVDIQQVLATGDIPRIREHARQLVTKLGVPPQGGFLPMQYGDYMGAGHTKEAVLAMIDEYKKLSVEFFGG
ncbi:MAG: hypothetical protein FWD16_01685 [Clostridia bacterium]|nr:hypothetical protein [Clostridia bacterium]